LAGARLPEAITTAWFSVESSSGFVVEALWLWDRPYNDDRAFIAHDGFGKLTQGVADFFTPSPGAVPDAPVGTGCPLIRLQSGFLKSLSFRFSDRMAAGAKLWQDTVFRQIYGVLAPRTKSGVMTSSCFR